MFLLFLIAFSWGAEKVEKIVLTGGVEFSQKMVENDVFFKWVQDFDVDDKYIYLADATYKVIFKIALDSGKLERTISSKGQGPGELAFPVNICVKNNKVFVIDKGFGGIKIFGVDGSTINEFKVSGAVGRRGIAVDEKDNIYIGNIMDNTLVSVYSLAGKRLRSLVKATVDLKDKDSIKKRIYWIKIDKQKNIYVLYFVARELEKYDNQGKMLWRAKIENDLLAEYPQSKNPGYRNIFDFHILDNNDILIAHAKGGCILDTNGKLKKVIELKTGLVHSFGFIKTVRNNLITLNLAEKNVVFFDLRRLK